MVPKVQMVPQVLLVFLGKMVFQETEELMEIQYVNARFVKRT